MTAFDPAFTGTFAYLEGALRVADAPDEGVPGTELLKGSFLHRALDVFGAGYPRSPRRPLASYWSLWYFGSFLVPAAVASLRLRRRLPVELQRVRVVLAEEPGSVPEVLLPGAGAGWKSGPAGGAPGRADDSGQASQLLHALVGGHLEPLVSSLAGHAGLARRLLWGNAAHYLEWTLTELAAEGGEGGAEAREARALLDAPRWPDGRRNPLAGAVRYVEEDGERVRRRKVCCLRNRVTGVEGCGSLCPLASVRCAAAVG